MDYNKMLTGKEIYQRLWENEPDAERWYYVPSQYKAVYCHMARTIKRAMTVYVMCNSCNRQHDVYREHQCQR
jgi:hypothetical protein